MAVTANQFYFGLISLEIFKWWLNPTEKFSEKMQLNSQVQISNNEEYNLEQDIF